MEIRQEQVKFILILRITLILCLWLAALFVLINLIDLFYYLAFLWGKVSPDNQSEAYEAMQKISEEPLTFLGWNLYNIIIWNLVIVSAVWLFRYYAWARILLKNLLGLDLIITVAHLLWEASRSELKIYEPGWFIAVNAIQVLAIIALSHPEVIQVVQQLSPRKQPYLKEPDLDRR